MGNLLGAILPGIELANRPGNEAFFFIADLHTLTTVHQPETLRRNTYATAAAWLACGFDTDKGYFYRQSDIPEVTELTWYLSCVMQHSRLELAVSFKDKQEKLGNVSAGLFFYPVLMAADILMYDAEIIPVGKDQLQHLEMTRDIADRFNHIFGNTLVLPEPSIREDGVTVPGVDGQKMSKSYGNEINIFVDDKTLQKRVRSIVTDSKGVEEVKDPDTCTVYKLHSLVAPASETEELRKMYLAGGMGYGVAKDRLFEAIRTRFSKEREQFAHFMANTKELDERLAEGAEKAGVVAYEVLARVREKVGYKKFAH
jgi:tryptophanyl-tRNA synthetase